MFLTTPSTTCFSCKRGDQRGALLGAALFQHGAARHDDIAAAAIHLEDLEQLRLVHQRADIAHRAHVDLAAGQERHGAVEIDGEAALDAAEDHAGDAGLVVEGLLQLDPAFLAAGLVAATARLRPARSRRAPDRPRPLSPTLTSAGMPGMANSLRETRPSVFRPTSTIAKSFSMATMVPLMTAPSWRALGLEALLRAWPRNRRGWGWQWSFRLDVAW